ncbi:MAG: hypothetical protein A3D28_05340 [Omnitrophica bacterium RIFCSPHIGHO2_02_FULL_63_14]|nr:MAG: hypothetical protein A3D28_05340 [Omnitrophica bacterium RIFCSPHIGHO2_02_FULL_63_14]
MDENAKRVVLRLIPYGLYVIGVKDDDAFHAFTGSWFSQCSMKPPRVMLGVREGTHSSKLLKKGKVFSVNFLAKTDKKIFERFFKPAPADGNRFGEVTYSVKKTGAPVLDIATHYLECEVSRVVDAGDHSVVIGEVVGAEVLRDEPPLTMSDTNWHYGG